MASVFDLDNALVYYVDRLLPGTPSRFADIISVINASGVTLAFAGDPADITYNPPIEQALGNSGTPESIDSATFTNNTDAQDTKSFKKGGSITAAFSTSTTQGIKIGAQTTLETGIPFLAKGQVTLSAEGSFSSTSNTTTTQTQTFETQDTINIPPRSRVEVSLVVDLLQYTGTVTAKVQVGGRVFINFGSTSLVKEISDIFKAIKERPPGNFSVTDKRATYTFTDRDLALFEVTSTNEVLYTATTAVNAKFGSRQRTDVQQFDLGSGRMVREFTL